MLMLTSLYVQNYAIIDQIELEFGPGFNVITGETGAGKSILLGALNLILGARADTRVLYDDSIKCIVQANFQLENGQIENWSGFDDIEIKGPLLELRREINNNGKSRALVNGTIVKLSSLREIAEQLVDIHNQFDTLSFRNPEYQLQIIDAVAQNQEERTAYLKVYEKYIALKAEIHKLQNARKQSQEDLDYIRHQLDELNKIPLDKLDKNSLETEYNTLSSSEDIRLLIQRIQTEMGEEDHSIESRLIELSRSLRSFEEINPRIVSMKEGIDEMLDSLRGILRQGQRLDDSLDYSEERLLQLKESLDHLNLLEKKHKASNVEELIELRDSLSLRASGSQDVEGLLKRKELEFSEMRSELINNSKILTASREKACKPFAEKIESALHELAMPNARVEILCREAPDFGPTGLDEISILFSSNKGISPQILGDIASGGELSRMVLAMKSLLADQLQKPSLIFDEIDTGISGAVALKVAQILDNMSFSRQVIAITHSPQLASLASRHFLIEKRDTDTRTLTFVSSLEGEKRIYEIAKMLSSDPPGAAARENARELLNLN